MWNDVDDSIKSIQQFFDIRIKFDSNKAARKFHRDYLPQNSEHGTEVKNHRFKIYGVDDLKVYTQSEMMNALFLEPYGLQAFTFLFVVNDYFVKFYVTCRKDYKPKFFERYIIEARDKIKLSSSE